MPQVTLIEHRDNSHSIRYTPEPVAPSIWVREWKYQDIPSESLKEIMDASTDRVEFLLSKLYHNEN